MRLTSLHSWSLGSDLPFLASVFDLLSPSPAFDLGLTQIRAGDPERQIGKVACLCVTLPFSVRVCSFHSPLARLYTALRFN